MGDDESLSKFRVERRVFASSLNGRMSAAIVEGPWFKSRLVRYFSFEQNLDVLIVFSNLPPVCGSVRNPAKKAT